MRHPIVLGEASKLSPLELEILKLLHIQNKEICDILNMKQRTVEKRVECILYKLNTNTRAEAILMALKKGTVELKDIYVQGFVG